MINHSYHISVWALKDDLRTVALYLVLLSHLYYHLYYYYTPYVL